MFGGLGKGRHGFHPSGCLYVQYAHLKEEAECPTGAHLNFATYGNLKSSVWRENKPLPGNMPDLIESDITYGESPHTCSSSPCGPTLAPVEA